MADVAAYLGPVAADDPNDAHHEQGDGNDGEEDGNAEAVFRCCAEDLDEKDDGLGPMGAVQNDVTLRLAAPCTTTVAHSKSALTPVPLAAVGYLARNSDPHLFWRAQQNARASRVL